MLMPLVHPKWRWPRRLHLVAQAAAVRSILSNSSRTSFSLGWPTWPIRFMLDRMRTHRRPAAGVVVVVGSVDLHRVDFTIHGGGGLLAVAVQYAEESEEEEAAAR